MKIRRSVTRVGLYSFSINIPNEVCDLLNIDDNSEFDIDVVDEKVILELIK